MHNLAGLICASTSGSQYCIAQSAGIVSLLRNKGYIVQTFVVAQTPAPACHILQHVSGRRVVSLEPWLHAGSTLQNVFWSSAEGADAAVVVVPESLLETEQFDLPAWSLSTDLLDKLGCPVLHFLTANDSPADTEQASKTLPPDHLLLTGPDGFAPVSDFPQDLIRTVQNVRPSCRLLGVIPGATIHPAIQALHAEPATAEPLTDLFSTCVAFPQLESAMASAHPQQCIPRPPQPLPTHVKECCTANGRPRIAVATDLGEVPSQLQGNLAVLEALGCELTNVSMTDATCLPPDVSGLYLSASLTPASADALSANLSMRLSVAAFAAAGGVVYAEGAGLAYLSTSVRTGEETLSMAGVLPMHVIMHEQPQARGYVRLRVQPPAEERPPLLQPGEWLRGIADTCLEVREEVPTRGLGRATRLGPLKVAQLFEALLVDPPAAGGSGPAIAQASQMHGIDTVQEGYAHGTVAATLVHVAFASRMAALQPLVAACAACDAWAIATAAAQHAAARRRSAALMHTHTQRRQPGMVHSGSVGSMLARSAEHHPLVRISGESASVSTTSSPPRSITPPTSTSTRSGEQNCVSPHYASATGATLAACMSEPLRAVSTDGSVLRAAGDPQASATRPRDIPTAARTQRLPLVGSVPENLWPPREGPRVSRSASYSALRPTGTQWWMQPLPRVRMLSGWELSATSAPLWPASSLDSNGGSARPSGDPKATPPSMKALHAVPADDARPLLPLGDSHAAGTAFAPAAIHPAAPDARPLVVLSPSVAHILAALGLSGHITGGPSAIASLSGSPHSQHVQCIVSVLPDVSDGPPRPRFGAPGHRRTNSTTKDPSLPGPWRATARRIAFMAKDWQPLHELHVDRIAALRSPMVLAWEPERLFGAQGGGVLPVVEAAHAPVLDALRRMDAPADVVTLPAPRSVSDVFAAISCVGAVVGAAAAADALVERLRNALRALTARCFARPLPSQQPRRVLVLRSVAPYILAGGWMPELVRLTGATCAGAAPGDGAREIEWSHIVEYDADAILILPEVVSVEEACAEAAVLAGEPGWWGLSAVRQREMFVADGAAMQSAGPGLLGAMKVIARACRPDLRAELGDGPGEVSVRKLDMAEGQRCRPSLLPGFFRKVW
eukprot:jgi/Ulvmu1/4230/UM191_0003.1